MELDKPSAWQIRNKLVNIRENVDDTIFVVNRIIEDKEANENEED